MQTTGTVCVDVRAVDVFEVDHRLAPVRVALAARLHAGLAADAAARVDEELESSARTASSSRLLLRLERAGVCRRPSALRTRTAQTLYSGIFEIGSCAAIGQLVGALRAGPVVRDEHRVGPDRRHDLRAQRDRRRGASRPSTQSPSAMPSCAASRGWISRRGSGYCRPAGRCAASACRTGTG